VLLKNCIDTCIAGIVWWSWGYGLAFGDVNGGYFGRKYFFGQGIEED